MEELDCVVIGAGKLQRPRIGPYTDPRSSSGWYGLAAAKQYHVTQPKASLAVLDSQVTLGGTWADHRLYPGLRSNNLLGTYEYPDFPMDSATFNIKAGEHIPGQVISNYLNAYAAHFGIKDLIRLETKVVTAEHQDSVEGGWILKVTSPKQSETRIFARRLILATGLTSEAFLPCFDGQENFDGKIFHGKHFRDNQDTLQTAKSVTVFGGTKFGWDAVYAYATAGVSVNWVIRCTIFTYYF
jgi:cation diffusion facilitator CzcD-associated flavoprotein CzcO